ncbi:MAG: SRPBCC family protein [Bacteroidetes bacterium]|nr:SRPBCC family protein [Bacteroidota bacterium]
MTTIELHTTIKAPVEKVFDLSRNIDFHMLSASQTHEKAIAGITTGLIGYGETVTWRGRHFGLFLKHTSKIVAWEHSKKFTDIMIEGHFKYFAHQHFFEKKDGHTLMRDILKYKVPFGPFGQLFNVLFLKRHLTKFIQYRNLALKELLENKKPLPN